jgi:repressor LexA
MTMIEKIEHILTEKKINKAELARGANIPYTTIIGLWEKGTENIKRSNLIKLAGFLQCSIDYLADDNITTEEKPVRKGVKIPVLGTVAAGIPIEAVEDIIDYEEITPQMAQKGAFFGLLIKGDSMTPRICEGDVVIARRQDYADSGDVAIVLINGGEATCKQVIRKENGLLLQAFNPIAYPTEFYTPEQVKALPVNILGVVVELRGKFKRV